ncbi:MAG: redoxin domain-containing protein [Sphingobacterium sp.]
MNTKIKKSLWTGLIALSATQLMAQQELKINAEFETLANGQKVYLTDFISKRVDSTSVANKKFQFTANADSSTIYIVQLGLQPKENEFFFMDMGSGQVNISSKGNSFKDAVFSGSAFVGRWKEMDAFMLSRCGGGINYPNELAQKMAQAQTVGDAQALENLQKDFGAYVDKGKIAAKEWIAKYPDEPVSAYVINAFLLNKIPLDEVKALVKSLGPNAQKSKLAHLMLTLEAPKLSSNLLNQQAPDFTLNDDKGVPVKLSDFKGKYVLLDFWASWCAPCRKEMPFVKAAFDKYNSPKFTILSVSIDAESEKWRKALTDEKMPWKQLIEDSTQQVSTLYNVTFIPMNFLIDPAGKVIAFGLYGENIDKQLGDVLK